MGLATSKGRAEQSAPSGSATIQPNPFAVAAGVQRPSSCTSSTLSQSTSSCSCLSGRSSEEVVAPPLSDMLQQGLQILMQLTHTTLNCRVAALLDADMVNVASHGLVSHQQITAFNSLMSWTMCQQHQSSLNLQRGEHATSCPVGGSDSMQDLATPPLPKLFHGSWRDASASPQQRRVADKLKVASFWACRLPGDGVLCLAFGSASSKLSPHQQGVLVHAANLAALQLQLQQQQRRSSQQFQTLRRRHRDLHRSSKAAEVAWVAADEVFRDELSHNLRTPLSAVRACSQLLLEGKGPDKLSPGPANLVSMIDAAGHELQSQLMKALEKTLRASSTKVRDSPVLERAPPPTRRHSLDGRRLGSRGSLSPVAEHSAPLGGKQHAAALASVPQCLTTSEAMLRLCRLRSLPGSQPSPEKGGPIAAQAGGKPEPQVLRWAPAQPGSSHWHLVLCTEGTPSKRRNLADMARLDSDQLTMAAGQQDSCKVPTAPLTGWPASSQDVSMADSRSETSAEASNRRSGDLQAVLPVAGASAEAQERQEAGQAQQTRGQVREVVLGGRRSQSLKEPLRCASPGQPQDTLLPSRSLPASLGQAAALSSLHQHLLDSARRAAAACQALSCSTSNRPSRHGCRDPPACARPLPRTSPPRAVAPASQAQSLNSPCAGDASDRHTPSESVAAIGDSNLLPCSSRTSGDEARPGCRAAAAGQACLCGRGCAVHAQDVRGSTTLESVVGVPAPSSASGEAKGCCRAASACCSPPSRDRCSSSPPKSVAEEPDSPAPTDVAATVGRSEGGSPSGEPLQATAAASHARGSSDRRGWEPLRSSQALRVLVAEDNVVNRKVLVRLLAHIGFHADAVGDGLEALQAVQQTCYDVLLLDLRMPRMNGVEAATHIAHEVPPQRQPRWIFALTADMLSTVEGPCRDAGMSGYMEKPYDASKLRDVLTKLQQEAHRTSCTSERHWVGRL